MRLAVTRRAHLLLAEFLFWLRWRADFATFNALQKFACQTRLAGMALAVHCAEVEELFYERVALAGLGQKRLQCPGQLAQT